jgi:hypothetical protein
MIAVLVGASAAIGCLVWLGLVLDDNARKRRVLARVAGRDAPPERLVRAALESAMDDLESAWNIHGRTLLTWRYLYPAEVADRSLELYWALCRYDAALTGDPVMTHRARVAWERVRASRAPAALVTRFERHSTVRSPRSR